MLLLDFSGLSVGPSERTSQFLRSDRAGVLGKLCCDVQVAVMLSPGDVGFAPASAFACSPLIDLGQDVGLASRVGLAMLLARINALAHQPCKSHEMAQVSLISYKSGANGTAATYWLLVAFA